MYRIGIDLGGTNIVAAVVDETYTIISRATCKTAMPRPAEDIMDDMARLVKEAAAQAGVTMQEVAFVGIGCPGTVNRATGMIEYANNLDFQHLPLQAEMEARLGCPVALENDANAAAFGEYVAGSGKDVDSCVCITLGTGVGGGVILDGNIFTGCNSSGAELGHIVIVADGEDCTCGRRGCWEAYSSATALIRQTRAAMEAHPESRLWEIAPTLDEVSGKTAFDGRDMGDPVATEVVNYYIHMLGCGLTNIVNIFQPEVLSIGGGICKQGDKLLKPLYDYICAERYSKNSQKQTRLEIAQLGNDAGLIGAAFLDKSE